MKVRYLRDFLIIPTFTLLSSCHTFNAADETLRHLQESENLCAVAANKKAYLGEELILSGTLVTDFRHYSLLEAKCGNKKNGLSLGAVFPSDKNNKIESDWWRDYCGSKVPSCITYFPVKIRGKLVKRDDGIDFDVIDYVEVGPGSK
jgi:hypothetical protein